MMEANVCPTCQRPLQETIFDFDGCVLTFKRHKQDFVVIVQEVNLMSFLEVLWRRLGHFVPYESFYIPIWGTVDADRNEDPANILRVMKHKLSRRLEGTPLEIRNRHAFGYGLFWKE